MNLNESVHYGGRRYVVVGFDPISVNPQRVYLRDGESGEEVTPLLTDLLGALHAEQEEDASVAPHCLACGAPLQSGLVYGGSLRCLECRESNVPLDPLLVAAWQANGAAF
jgi:hypothetical protein